MNSQVTGCDIKPGYRTDHSLIDIQFDFNQMDRGPGYWKFNNALLSDTVYVDQIKNGIKKVVETYAAFPYLHSNLVHIHPNDIHFIVNDQLFFEVLLLEIRSKTISYASWKKKSNNKRESHIETVIQNLFYQISQGDLTVTEELKSKQTELIDLRKKKMEGVLIRSKTRWIEEGEKPSRYFLNMEKRKMINKTISSVVRDDNTYARSSCEILNESRLFYKKLYSEAENLNDSNLSCVFNGVPVLSDKLRESLEGPLSYHELLNALKGSKNDKSPGSDGFSFEFYKFFFSDIVHGTCCVL